MERVESTSRAEEELIERTGGEDAYRSCDGESQRLLTRRAARENPRIQSEVCHLEKDLLTGPQKTKSPQHAIPSQTEHLRASVILEL